jgi:hypothetical protein
MLRRRGGDPDRLRTELAEHLRATLACRAYRDPVAERRLARLESGEEVEVPGWMLWRWSPQWRNEPRVRIAPDGTVEAI